MPPSSRRGCHRRRRRRRDWGRRIAGWSPRERPLLWFVANVLATGASMMLLIECGVAQATQRRCVAPTATAFYLIWAALLTALWCTQLIVERVHACTSTATNNNSNDNNNISHEDTTSLQVPPPPTPTHGTRWRCDRLSSYHGMVELRDHFPRSVETVMAAAFLLYAWLALWRWDLSRHGLAESLAAVSLSVVGFAYMAAECWQLFLRKHGSHDRTSFHRPDDDVDDIDDDDDIDGDDDEEAENSDITTNQRVRYEQLA